MLFINAQAPEESKIAFGSGRCPPGNPLVRSEIYVMDEDGNNQRRLTQNPAIEGSPAPGPSLRIAFSSRRDGNDEIDVMDADGNNQRRLTNNPVFDRTPAWFSTANTISLKCLCIDRVNQVKKFAWSGTRSLFSVQSRRGKMPRLRVSGRYIYDIICTVIHEKWYKYPVSPAGKLRATWGWLKQKSK